MEKLLKFLRGETVEEIVEDEGEEKEEEEEETDPIYKNKGEMESYFYDYQDVISASVIDAEETRAAGGYVDGYVILLTMRYTNDEDLPNWELYCKAETDPRKVRDDMLRTETEHTARYNEKFNAVASFEKLIRRYDLVELNVGYTSGQLE